MKNYPAILMCIGTRPEVIKMAPVYLEFQKRGIKPILLHTGQHNEIALSLYELFGMKPDQHIDLDRKNPGALATHGDQMVCDLSALGASLLSKISRVMKQTDPDMVMVHGDTSSALLAALSAFYQKRKIAHVEAGLRSFQEMHPFPEEKNRVLIGQLAHLHFAPTERAKDNLLREGINEGAIHVVGNTIVQATQLGAERFDHLRKEDPEAVPELIDRVNKDIKAGKRMVLVTVHRRENQDTGISSIGKAIIELLQRNDDLFVVWPVHPNPKVAAAVNAEINNAPPEVQERVHLTRPLQYPVLLWLLKNAWIALTDSGGIQEESVALNTPVLVLRETTERPEIIEVGAGMVVGTNMQNIISKVEELIGDEQKYLTMRKAKNPFGDNEVASRICNTILNFLQ